MNYTIAKNKVPEFLDSLKKKFEVIVPVKEPQTPPRFESYAGQDLFLQGRTAYSPKRFFRPGKEKIFSFKKNALSYDITPEIDGAKRVIFGVRPCDTHALDVLDVLFIKYFGEDRFYSRRRNNAIIIALQCLESCENGFCTSMGTSQAIGHDLLFIERGPDYFVQAVTEKGKKLAENKLFRNTSDAQPTVNIKNKTKLDTTDLGNRLYSEFDNKVWKEESERCLSCSSCTQICPTCYCYNTDDEFVFGSDSESERFRLLSSCQLKKFTKVAGNHVFRESRASRLRQFVLHKLSYFEENHEKQLCVGCGRCITACPTNISLVEIANSIQKGAGK